MQEYAIWLSLCKLSKRKKAALLQSFGSAQAVYEAGKADLVSALPTLTVKELDSLWDKDLRAAMRIQQELDRCGARVIDLTDAQYPPLLREIADPPTLLYFRGSLPDWSRYLPIAIVGQRKATAAGRKHASGIAYTLSRNGVLVVSGMADGIDGAAHQGALDGGSPTVAVLGTPIDKCYPAHHAGLMRDILQNGAVLSEYPPGASTFPGNFLSRNRIVSGMSRGVVVVEATGRSGALETAGKALEQNRDIFAVPGPIDSEDYIGTNRLIQEGAFVVIRAEDILRVYGAVEETSQRKGFRDLPDPKEKKKKPARSPEGSPAPVQTSVQHREEAEGVEETALDLTELAKADPEQAVLAAIGQRTNIDTIVEKTGLSAEQVMVTLTMLELQGLIAQKPGNYYEKQR